MGNGGAVAALVTHHHWLRGKKKAHKSLAILSRAAPPASTSWTSTTAPNHLEAFHQGRAPPLLHRQRNNGGRRVVSQELREKKSDIRGALAV
jgi:hypothetical protein